MRRLGRDFEKAGRWLGVRNKLYESARRGLINNVLNTTTIFWEILPS